MKKYISIFLMIILVMTTMGVSNFAADKTDVLETASTENNFVTAEPDFGEVCFSAAYAEPGKEIKAYISGRESKPLLYKWYLDNVQINDFTDSYTPSEGDYEKILTVKIYDTDCELVGEKSMLISPLPVVYIEVDNRKTVESKDIQLDAQMKIQGNSEYNDSAILYEGKTQIKGRGNTTWDAAKKPYKLKLDSKADLFGMGKNKHWVLLSNPFDSSNMRNDVAYKLAADMGLASQDCVWVELVLNGKFVGIYQLCEHVRIDDNRVEITDWDDIAEEAAKAIYKKNTDIMSKDERDELVDIMTNNMNWTTTDTVTYKGNTFTVSDYYEIPSINGGYLLEVDWHEVTHNFRTPSNANVAVGKPEGIGTDMFNYIKNYYLAFETALYADDFCTKYDGQKMRYTDFADLESLAKGVLINEIFENYDFGLNSTYFSKEIDGKLIYGPVWDMDYTTVSGFNLWTTAKKPWIKELLSDPVFVNELRNQYIKYRYTDIQDMISEGGDIDKAINKIYTSSVHNDTLWNNTVKFEENAKDLKTRLQMKINWLDSKLLSLDTAFASTTENKGLTYTKSGNIALAVADDTLSMTFNTVPASVSVYANGNLYKVIEPTELTEKLALSPADSDVIYTAVAYDADGKALYGNYISTERYVKSLTVTTKPAKMTYAAGETLDLTGLVLTANYSNGTSEAVEPQLVCTYTKDAFGAPQYCVNKVSEQIGTVYAVFMYGGVKTELKLTVSAGENYEDVEQLIAKIPADKNDAKFVKALFEARIAYNALSADAKAKVSNVDDLNAAITRCSERTAGEKVGVFDWFADGAQRYDSKNNVIVAVKFEPRKVIFEYATGGTSSFARDSECVLSIKKVGTYEFWTINMKFTTDCPYFNLRVAYPGSLPNDNYKTYVADMFNTEHDFSNVDCKDYAVIGEKFTVDATVSEAVTALKLTENGTEIGSTTEKSDDRMQASAVFRTAGNHTVTLSYEKDGLWFDYGDFDISVREPVDSASVTPCIVWENGYKETTAVKIVTGEDTFSVVAASESDSVEFECEFKNGFAIWTGEIKADEEYNILVNWEAVEQKVSAVRLGDVNVDGMINSYDALLALQFSTDLKVPTESEALRADVNGDGEISSYDALIMLKISTDLM